MVELFSIKGCEESVSCSDFKRWIQAMTRNYDPMSESAIQKSVTNLLSKKGNCKRVCIEMEARKLSYYLKNLTKYLDTCKSLKPNLYHMRRNTYTTFSKINFKESYFNKKEIWPQRPLTLTESNTLMSYII